MVGVLNSLGWYDTNFNLFKLILKKIEIKCQAKYRKDYFGKKYI